ncbi:MAG: hypothetical protein IJV41_07390 [Oscillospiraceae bacterium]|nr:hypothetical protein [Oscillospiraceae bacterium]
MTDKRIVEAYDQLRLDPDSAARIVAALEKAAPPREEKNTMTKAKRPLRIFLIAAIISVLMIGTAYAFSGNVHAIGTHYMRGENEYTSLSDLPKAVKTAGYPITAVEEFSNGYRFVSMHIGGEAAYDENYNVLQEYYSVALNYAKPGAADVIVNVSPVLDLPTESEAPAPTDTRTVNGVPVRYSRDHYKFVPPDYQETEADQAAKAAGHYYVSYGSDGIEEHDYTFASFDLGDVNYTFMSMSPMESEAMYAMAGDIITAWK